MPRSRNPSLRRTIIALGLVQGFLLALDARIPWAAWHELTNTKDTVTITNESAELYGNRLLVTFDLHARDAVPIWLIASPDGGKTWELRVLALKGDVGHRVAPGKGKRIEWNTFFDYPRGMPNGVPTEEVLLDLYVGHELIRAVESYCRAVHAHDTATGRLADAEEEYEAAVDAPPSPSAKTSRYKREIKKIDKELEKNTAIPYRMVREYRTDDPLGRPIERYIFDKDIARRNADLAEKSAAERVRLHYEYEPHFQSQRQRTTQDKNELGKVIEQRKATVTNAEKMVEQAENHYLNMLSNITKRAFQD
jgi:hypothetical protein